MRRRRKSIWNYGWVSIPVLLVVVGIFYFLEKEFPERHFKTEKERTTASDEAALSAQNEEIFKKGTLEEIKLDPGECSSVEYPGGHPAEVVTNVNQWKDFMQTYRSVKIGLMDWLTAFGKLHPELNTKELSQTIEDLRVRRPPTVIEPDLVWRGIGVLTQDGDGALVRIGGGFLNLHKHDKIRAKFEIARLVAQAWDPCKWKDGYTKWKPVLECLGVHKDWNCKSEGFSEGAWALSTAIAAWVSPPKCKIHAFKSDVLSACLNPKKKSDGIFRSLGSTEH